MATTDFAYHRPKTLDEAWRLLDATPGAQLIAGGTDCLVRARRRCALPVAFVSLRNIAELCGIEAAEQTRIGAATPLADVLAHPAVRERHPVLCEAIAAMASVQVRNVATLGGNLCNASPCADSAPPLLVLDAHVRLRGPDGVRELRLEDFFAGPGTTRLGPREVMTDVLIDRSPPGTRATFLRLGRVAMDLALASVAMLAVVESGRCRRARLAAGAVAPTPIRLARVEAILEGAVLSEELIARAREAAMAEVSPIDDLRASADYRRALVGAFVKRATERLLGEELDR